MADHTGIQWTDATWNPIAGCSIVSPACTNCYAMAQAARIVRCAAGAGRETHYADTVTTVKGKPVWTGALRRAPDHVFTQPLRWRRPRRIFVNSMSDLFHEAVPDDWIDRIFAVMALAPQHTFQILTKRPERMRAYMSRRDDRGRWPAMDYAALMALTGRYNTPALDLFNGWPLPNVWLGVTAERQQEADERLPVLLDTLAAKRFVSIEPMLGPVDIGKWMLGCYECAEVCGWRSASAPPREKCHNCGMTSEIFGEFCPSCGHQDFNAVCPECEADAVQHHPDTTCLDWVICGGESGPGARPMHPDWARSLRDQCAAAGAPFFFKQWGEWAPVTENDRRASKGMRATPDGRIDSDWTSWNPATDTMLMNIGKRAAGRLLDGVEHNAFPEG